MDETNEAMSQILHGCKLAKDLESKLRYLENQPHFLSSSCEEITKAFNKAIGLLNSDSQHMIFGESSSQPCGGPQSGTRVPQDLLSGYTQPMDLFHSNALAGSNLFNVGVLSEREGLLELGSEIPTGSSLMEYCSAGETDGFPHSGSSGEIKAAEVSDSGMSSPTAGALSVARSRSRKDAGEKRTITVPAPREGNTETPPDDGFTWRKYGQKEILNSKFPRGYYRCTHKNYYGCEAKKQVQRLDDDPLMVQVTYCGHHTCQTSPTPLVLSTTETQHGMLVTTQGPSVSTSIHLGSWFSSHLDATEKNKNAPMDPHAQMYRGFHGTGERSTAHGESSSHGRGGKEMETSAEDLAEFMFNQGGSGNSIDAIFSPKKED
ncbi:WRKY transcription factor 55-like [Magnolia sinica]|uniref:WRKY transcription factor 55-like n=1 Tax=Magnolia sinica TaxID=86752 RepID=UPI002658C3A6|nr:WRKY transcription factor 55-like [Magnolia sinica]